MNLSLPSSSTLESHSLLLLLLKKTNLCFLAIQSLQFKMSPSEVAQNAAVTKGMFFSLFPILPSIHAWMKQKEGLTTDL